MKKIFAIALKDTLLRFTGWSEWLFFLILPIVFTLVLAGGTGGSADSRVRLVVVDEANSPLSADLVAALQNSQAVRPELMTLAKAEAQFSQRSANAVLVIPAEFDLAHIEKGSIQLELRQQPNNLSAMVAQRAVMSVISRVSSAADIANASVAAAEKIQPFASNVERQAYFDAALKQAQSLLSAAPSRVTESRGNTPELDPLQPAHQLFRRTIDHVGIYSFDSHLRHVRVRTPERHLAPFIGFSHPQKHLLDRNYIRTGGDRPGTNAPFGRVRHSGDETQLGEPTSCPGSDVGCLCTGCGCPGDNTGDSCQDGKPGERPEHYDRYGDGPAGRLLVPA